MVDEWDLQAAIIASPDDDTPRSVYADWLLERGDPRGEFIALQLEHAAGRSTRAKLVREGELLRAHGEAWGGAIAKWFIWPAFERGFFAGGTP
ncbi:MAG TPA: TIGR02996 domain-containing protein [Kofleriaceae bacterium]